MKLTRFPVLTLVLAALTPLTLAQTTIQVPAGEPTIQAGINLAVNGDTVRVAPGTYSETIDFLGKRITVKSSMGPLLTTIDGSGMGASTVVSFLSAETKSSVLEGFTITGGTGSYLGGGGGPVGGGVVIDGASPLIRNCILDQNDIGFSAQGGGLWARNSSVRLVGTTVSANEASIGAGLWFDNSQPTLIGVTIDANIGTGAVFQNSSPTFRNCTITFNVAGMEGGGVLFADCTDVTFEDCTLNDNDGLFGPAGAIHIRNSDVTMTGCEVARNIATFDDHRGGGIFVESGSLDFSDGVFRDNESAQGGAIWSAGTLVLSDTLVVGNSSTFTGFGLQGNGGGVYVGGGTAVITRCVFDSNSAATLFGPGFGGQGGAVWGPADLIHCTLFGNTATWAGEGGGVWDATMDSCIHWGNTPPALPATNPPVSYSDVEGSFPGPGNLNSNPLLSNPAGGDFTLLTGSPCINTGNPGNPLDPDGSRADMGAFPSGDPFLSYCTAGTSASGCQALLIASGSSSASAPSGFFVSAIGMEGSRDGLVYWGTSGRQAATWGTSSSFQCVVPPTKRGALVTGSGIVGTCTGAFTYDLNARWASKPAQNPGPGALVQLQFWYRDALSTSGMSTSISNALEFAVAP